MAMSLDEAVACQTLARYLLGGAGDEVDDDQAAAAAFLITQASFERLGFGVSGSAAFAAGVEPRPWIASAT